MTVRWDGSQRLQTTDFNVRSAEPIELSRSYGRLLGGEDLQYTVADPYWLIRIEVYQLSVADQETFLARVAGTMQITIEDSGRRLDGFPAQPRWANARMNGELVEVRQQLIGRDNLAGTTITLDFQVQQSEIEGLYPDPAPVTPTDPMMEMEPEEPTGPRYTIDTRDLLHGTDGRWHFPSAVPAAVLAFPRAASGPFTPPLLGTWWSGGPSRSEDFSKFYATGITIPADGGEWLLIRCLGKEDTPTGDGGAWYGWGAPTDNLMMSTRQIKFISSFTGPTESTPNFMAEPAAGARDYQVPVGLAIADVSATEWNLVEDGTSSTYMDGQRFYLVAELRNEVSYWEVAITGVVEMPDPAQPGAKVYRASFTAHGSLGNPALGGEPIRLLATAPLSGGVFQDTMLVRRADLHGLTRAAAGDTRTRATSLVAVAERATFRYIPGGGGGEARSGSDFSAMGGSPVVHDFHMQVTQWFGLTATHELLVAASWTPPVEEYYYRSTESTETVGPIMPTFGIAFFDLKVYAPTAAQIPASTMLDATGAAFDVRSSTLDATPTDDGRRFSDTSLEYDGMGKWLLFNFGAASASESKAIEWHLVSRAAFTGLDTIGMDLKLKRENSLMLKANNSAGKRTGGGAVGTSILPRHVFGRRNSRPFVPGSKPTLHIANQRKTVTDPIVFDPLTIRELNVNDAGVSFPTPTESGPDEVFERLDAITLGDPGLSTLSTNLLVTGGCDWYLTNVGAPYPVRSTTVPATYPPNDGLIGAWTFTHVLDTLRFDPSVYLSGREGLFAYRFVPGEASTGPDMPTPSGMDVLDDCGIDPDALRHHLRVGSGIVAIQDYVEGNDPTQAVETIYTAGKWTVKPGVRLRFMQSATGRDVLAVPVGFGAMTIDIECMETPIRVESARTLGRVTYARGGTGRYTAYLASYQYNGGLLAESAIRATVASLLPASTAEPGLYQIAIEPGGNPVLRRAGSMFRLIPDHTEVLSATLMADSFTPSPRPANSGGTIWFAVNAPTDTGFLADLGAPRTPFQRILLMTDIDLGNACLYAVADKALVHRPTFSSERGQASGGRHTYRVLDAGLRLGQYSYARRLSGVI